MKIHGLPEQFWVVTRPSEFSTSDDILFRHRLAGRIALGISEVVELRNITTVPG